MVRLATILAATLVCGTARGAGEHTLRGTVRDEAGKAVGGVQVDDHWDFEWGEGMSFGGGRSDDAGSYELTVEAYGRPVALVALDAAGRRGALVCVDPEQDSAKSIDLELRPATRVFGKLASAELGHPLEWTNGDVYVWCGKTLVRIAQCSSVQAEFSFLLPEGEYDIDLYGTDAEMHTERYAVRGAELDLGTIDLAATKLAKLYGEPAPEPTISAARGIEPGMRLADLRGKFVVLEFWGHW